MGYEFHLRPVSLEAWTAAVEDTPGVRLASSNVVQGTNPRTGDAITIVGNAGDAEVELAAGDWVRAFRFGRGGVSFRGLDWTRAEPVAVVASRLARRLGAKITGDDGEEYTALE